MASATWASSQRASRRAQAGPTGGQTRRTEPRADGRRDANSGVLFLRIRLRHGLLLSTLTRFLLFSSRFLTHRASPIPERRRPGHLARDSADGVSTTDACSRQGGSRCEVTSVRPPEGPKDLSRRRPWPIRRRSSVGRKQQASSPDGSTTSRVLCGLTRDVRVGKLCALRRSRQLRRLRLPSVLHRVRRVDDLLGLCLGLLRELVGHELVLPTALRRDPRHLELEILVLRVVVHRVDAVSTSDNPSATRTDEARKDRTHIRAASTSASSAVSSSSASFSISVFANCRPLPVAHPR